MDKSGSWVDDAAYVEPISQSTELLESLQRRADKLLTEFRSYQAYLGSENLPKNVETRIFRRGVEAEHKNLGSFVSKDLGNKSDTAREIKAKDHESKRLQALRSSNLPFYEAVWASAKRCRAVTALGRRLYWDGNRTGINLNHLSNDAESPKPRQKKARSALVDIVADNGAEWIKVSIVTAKRLVFEMAREGWEGYGGGSDAGDSESEGEHSSTATSSEKGKLELVKLAGDLCDASQATRIKYRHPQVKFMLPRIREGEDDMIDAVVADIRATGATVVCGERPHHALGCHADQAPVCSSSTPPLFELMLPSHSHPMLTPTLNIDCTILLALISDISHVSRANLPSSPSNSSGTYHSAILKQIESEETTPLLPDELYPILEGRKLLCTELAAKRMREIVCTMGTKSETVRAEILLGQGKHVGHSSEDLSEAWQRSSCHVLSNDINLPIIVEEFAFNAETGRHDDRATHAAADNMARRLSPAFNLSPINASVFIYGWTNDIVTVTSNKVVAVGIERALNQIQDEDERRLRDGPTTTSDHREHDCVGCDFVGPKMYVCETARSLIGKDKGNGLGP